MIQMLLIVGSSIFVLLGAAHALFTFQDLGAAPRNFTPPDAGLLGAMRQSTVVFDPEINLWKSWLGFHFSHSLGLLMFGGAFLYVGVYFPTLFSRSMLLQFCSVLIPAIYVILSLNFWFSKPAIFAGISMAGFIAATALSYNR